MALVHSFKPKITSIYESNRLFERKRHQCFWRKFENAGHSGTY